MDKDHSIVILGGNECMECQYKTLCKKYNCKAKIYIKPTSGLKNKLGSPDLMIFFTGCMSHKMVHSAMAEVKGLDTVIEYSKSASASALKGILEKYCSDEQKEAVFYS